MALTITKLQDVPGMGVYRFTIWEVTGDGATRDITAASLGYTRIHFAFSVTVDNENFTPITTYSGTTISFDDEITNAKKQLVIAFGF